MVLAALTLMGAPVAAAHTELLWSTPDNGSVLAAAPTEVVLTFVDDLLEAAVKVSITDESGTVVAKDVAQADGADVTVPWPADLPPGTYSVNYRVVSADGHPVSDSMTFSYRGASSATVAVASTASLSPTGSVTAAATPSSGQPVLPIIIALLVVFAAGVAVTLALRRHSAKRGTA